MKTKRKKGFFSISAVAKMFSVHQQTIRLYEKQGLISPKRSSGNTRLFSEDDIDNLEEVIYLTHELGINLAGVEMILKLKKQINKMQKEINRMFQTTQDELDQQVEETKNHARNSVSQLLKIKKEQTASIIPSRHHDTQRENTNETSVMDDSIDMDNWEIEYDE